jgi:hypothetical protein
MKGFDSEFTVFLGEYLAMGCREQAGNQCAPACTMMALQGYHSVTNQERWSPFDDRVYAMAWYWTGHAIADTGNADSGNDMRGRS